MGLTNASTGLNAKDTGLVIKKRSPSDKVIALAGNPNVGKSTLFNALTGMRQHTGNWPGKTVANAQGYREYNGRGYVFVDIPGSYSLLAHSAEEEVAGDFICSGEADCVAVVCGASCLERNLNLVLQISEVTPKMVVCVNLMDEAAKKDIEIKTNLLEEKLGVPVIPMSARDKRGIDEFLEAIEKVTEDNIDKKDIYAVDYGREISAAVEMTGKRGREALKIIESYDTREPAVRFLEENGIDKRKAEDIIAASLSAAASDIAEGVVFTKRDSNERDRKLDKIFASRLLGFPVMAAMLAAVFWITISTANVPSKLLSSLLFGFEEPLYRAFIWAGMPENISNMLVFGMYRVVAWVVSVMLPPMAIFFPMFTILEDSGYLPRVAFNLDKCFKKCRACGKQALTICMGFGCNAAGVTGCRIIDSQRERLVAMLTNSFVPCNGRFPMMISVITMFFTGYTLGAGQSVLSAIILCGIIIFGIGMTFAASWILTKTVLKGVPSSFILEMPPYRRPKIGDVIVRSVLDRTIFVLGRAVTAAAPAGIVIWLMANIKIGNVTVLAAFSGLLDPFARFIGLDGVILTAFILGFPANEIVVPVMIMAYMQTGVLTDISNLNELRELLIANGWTWVTAVCMLLFSLMHWPCATTMLTIKKETGSLKWTAAAVVVPAVCGIVICAIIANIAGLIG
ncbi:MAG: ferrous iron transport protein B [Clostridiales bacterium]|nr:ferrous iron transport protein B [Clostridiales bacterium]